MAKFKIEFDNIHDLFRKVELLQQVYAGRMEQVKGLLSLHGVKYDVMTSYGLGVDTSNLPDGVDVKTVKAIIESNREIIEAAEIKMGITKIEEEKEDV